MLNIISSLLIMNTPFVPGNIVFAITFLFFTMLFQSTTMLFIIYMIKNEISKKIKIILYVFLTLDILIFLSLLYMAYIVTTSLKYY
ncbi:hypothetical protein F8166_09745 [Bacillus cereus]|uniref:Uncharacterized protein n=1 Tax=Bacillus cereus TaxID=1396 RepID=A0A9W7UNG2_BACCE|nr:hypothetical protein DX932_32160 [Bacillus cereus]KAA6455910.1 hypothetical protein DX930_31345 [Bacillus cereus]KAB2437047.1 hypothetical protein F8166_09745 [Bacillus cereus]KAB2469877.1 hypothetical protein F8164_05305 [Bacillus cereus]KAB2503178.1 hypothetical protein F8156_15670 [Bacillus cereus]